MSQASKVKAVVLAAGKGKRLARYEGDLPKVLREAAGRPLLSHVLSALDFIPREDIVLVVGYGREQVMERFPGYAFAVQERQLGTGHAVLSARDALRGFTGSVLVCNGDMPLLRRESYQALLAEHFTRDNACTLLSGVSDVPLPYGRVLRTPEGGFSRIVEERDCTPEELSVRELNSGVLAFKAPLLFPALERLKNQNQQGEYYLTDAPGLLRADGERVGVCELRLGLELIGVNTAQQLEQVEAALGKNKADF